MAHWSVAAKAAGLAVLFAVGAALWLALWPGFYQGVAVSPAPAAQDASAPSVEGPEGKRFSASLLKVNGPKALPLLLFPVVLAALGTLATLWHDIRGSKTALWVNGVLLGGFCLLALFSVGAFFVPSAVALVTAAVLNHGRQASPAAVPRHRPRR